MLHQAGSGAFFIEELDYLSGELGYSRMAATLPVGCEDVCKTRSASGASEWAVDSGQ